MPTEPGSPRNRRTHDRAPLRAPATLQVDAFSEPISGFTADVSLGGMFVATRHPQPVGAILRFEVELGSPAETVRGTAEVAWIRAKATELAQPAGMGLQFRFIEDQGKALLQATVGQALEQQDSVPRVHRPVARPRPRPPSQERRAQSARRHEAGPAQKKRAAKKASVKRSSPPAKILGLPAEPAKLLAALVLLGILAFLLLRSLG